MLKTVFRPLLFTLLVALTTIHPAAPVFSSSQEYAIKTAFLLNFAKFTEWPADALPEEEKVIHICILGNSPLQKSLGIIRDKTVHGKRLAVQNHASLDEVGKCQVLFISRSEKNNLTQIISKLGNKPILTVADMDHFAQEGGMINLVTHKNKIRFEINIESAGRAGLKISSNLLKLAHNVIGSVK